MKGIVLLQKLTTTKCANNIVKLGDDVKIEGDVQLTKKLVNVTMEMDWLINDHKVYKVEEIKESIKGPVIIRVKGWWWAATNIYKLGGEEPKPIDPQLFQIDQLVI